MTPLLNTKHGLYPALKQRADDVGRDVAEACVVVLPSSWEVAAAIILDDLQERGRISGWWDLEVNEDLRSVGVSIRPPFLPSAFYTRVTVIIPEDPFTC